MENAKAITVAVYKADLKLAEKIAAKINKDPKQRGTAGRSEVFRRALVALADQLGIE